MRYVGVAAIAAPLAIGRLLAQLPAMHAEDNGLAVDFTVTTPRQTPDPAISVPPQTVRRGPSVRVVVKDFIPLPQLICRAGAAST
jgi:hypothetical protein